LDREAVGLLKDLVILSDQRIFAVADTYLSDLDYDVFIDWLLHLGGVQAPSDSANKVNQNESEDESEGQSAYSDDFESEDRTPRPRSSSKLSECYSDDFEPDEDMDNYSNQELPSRSTDKELENNIKIGEMIQLVRTEKADLQQKMDEIQASLSDLRQKKGEMLVR
jgi:hypothetical protein